MSGKRYKEKDLGGRAKEAGNTALHGVRKSFSEEVTFEWKPEGQGGAGPFELRFEGRMF